MTKSIWDTGDDVDWDAVLDVAKELGSNVVLKRLGFLLSKLDMEEKVCKKIQNIVKKPPYDILDFHSGYPKITTSKEYGLVVNVEDRTLLGWMGY